MKHCYTIINKCLKLVNTLTLKHKQQIILKSKTETKNNKNSQVIRETAMVSHGFSSHSPLQPTDHTSFLHHAQHQISSVAQSCLTLQAHGLQHGNQFITNSGSLLRPHVQWVSDAIQPSHPFSCLQFFPASGFFQWLSSSHQVAKVVGYKLQHQSFQWIFRADFL